MPQILLNIPDAAKADEFLRHLVPYLSYVESVEVLPDTTSTHQVSNGYEVSPTIVNTVAEPVAIEYAVPVVEYRVEDIERIAAQFPSEHQWVYQDLVRHFPTDLKVKVEIIHNQLFVMPAPNTLHQIISDEITFQLNTFVRANKLGKILAAPVDVKLDDDNVVQPDILYIAVTRLEIIGENCIEGAPDLVVEIWSPGNKPRERSAKRTLYEAKGITEYWQIYPRKKEVIVEVLSEAGSYQVFSQAKKHGSVQSKVLSGFVLEIERIFPVKK